MRQPQSQLSITAIARLPALLFAIALSAALTAQTITGRVDDTDGKAVFGATVTAIGRGGSIVNQVVSDEHGRFAFEPQRELALVRLQYEAIEVDCDVPRTTGWLNVQLADLQLWVMRGHVVDPAGQPAAGIDVQLLGTNERVIAVVTTDAKGAYRLRSNQEIAAVVVDPLGWAHVETGPFRDTRGLAIDLRLVRDRYAPLFGRVLDQHGEPVAGARIVAHHHANGEQRGLATVRSRADGTFSLWTTEPATCLSATFGSSQLELAGRWQANDFVTLDERRDGLIWVRGTVIGRRGRVAERTRIFAAERPTAPSAESVARTNNSGQFYAQIRRGTPFLLAVDQAGIVAIAAAPWRSPIWLRPLPQRNDR